MPTYKTPGVYIEEISVLPPSIEQVATAIPVFIGYTEKAKKNVSNDLILKPTRIESMVDFESYFGNPADDEIELTIRQAAGGDYSISAFSKPSMTYLLHFSMRMFFANGGGPCYVVSVGLYQSTPVIDLRGNNGTDPETSYGLMDGLDASKSVDQVTLVVIPEAVKLAATDYSMLVQSVLGQCKSLQDRFAIFDFYGGDQAFDSSEIDTARGYYGHKYLMYGAAYYPFIKTTFNFYVNPQESNVRLTLDDATSANLGGIEESNPQLYNFIRSRIRDYHVDLPPSAAIAGVYASTDQRRGVWKAPANVSLNSVSEPLIKITNQMQRDLNIDPVGGKSINAIRAFSGRGTRVWGARTLAGNDNEWRYIPVRRFFIMVEESIQKSTAWAVFQPNDVNTWSKLQQMVENYLFQLWRQGALNGEKPDDAFYVRCGLGRSMTQNDISQGRLIIEIGMAVIRPAEFIIVKVSHKMQSG